MKERILLTNFISTRRVAVRGGPEWGFLNGFLPGGSSYPLLPLLATVETESALISSLQDWLR